MDAMGWLAWIIVGALSGWLASIVMRTSQGLLLDIVVGIVGAFIGGFLVCVLGAPGGKGLHVWSGVVSFVGVVVLLRPLRLFFRGRPAGVNLPAFLAPRLAPQTPHAF